MNLRKADSYSIGLDLGTGSVGWCVVDENGELFHFKGKPTWGSRLFPSGETAAARRVKRGQRRRYERRKQRINCLQGIFEDEMDKVDPEFFVRMKQSSLLAEDRDPEHPTEYHHPFFNGTDFTESDYYKRFPTIWHLRKFLMESDEKADLRLVYLALHNIVKYRGNFLHEDESNLTVQNSDSRQAAEQLKMALETYVDFRNEESPDDWIACEVDVDELAAALDAKHGSRSARAEAVASALHMGKKNPGKDMAAQISKACMGLKADFSKVFVGVEKGVEGSNFEVSNDEGTEKFLQICPEEALPLFEAILVAYSANILSSLLQGENSLSAAMIDSYNQHKADLAVTKLLVREHLGKDEYWKLFRGERYEDFPNDYDINKLPKNSGSYTAYIEGEKLAGGNGCTQEDLVKNFRNLFGSVEALEKENLADTVESLLSRKLDAASSGYDMKLAAKLAGAFGGEAGTDWDIREYAEGYRSRLYDEEGEFLPKQKTRANGAIPYQLHLEELFAIVEKQGRWYPFLLENEELLGKLVSSRIPYYVGPLIASQVAEDGSIDNAAQRKFAWSVRKPGMESAKAYPWNVDEVIDEDQTAELFITRMTGTCTYIYDEPVLPRHSLLYEEYCVLNELNGTRWSAPGQDFKRFDTKDRKAIVEELFKKRRTVSHKAVSDWLLEHGIADASITGTQGATAFESKLQSYNDFCKILGVSNLEDADCPLTIDEIEEVILWCTVFEDRGILKRKVEQKFGDVLSEEQVKKIVKTRYQGWGRLSRKFLCEIQNTDGNTPISIMDVLRDGNPLPGRHNASMVLMEVLHEDELKFEGLVEEENRKRLGEAGNAMSVESLPGSPALHRTVNQALRIVDEIVGIVGHAPDSIVIEDTRYEDEEMKGKRTVSRYNKLREALEAYRRDAEELAPGILGELEAKKDYVSSDNRLMLYFAQNGKCLYTGEALDINSLQSYHIDHIIPQAYIKDDSLDNLALVKQEQNERKLDSLLLSNSIVRRQTNWWRQLLDAGLISEKKFNNLTRTYIGDGALKGFINRQLVETSQVVKFVRQLCEQRYGGEGTEIVPLRAGLSSELRGRCGFVKCRQINDFHHAHDAYLACQIARFLEFRYPRWSSGFELGILRNHVKRLAESGKASGQVKLGKSGFVVDSFLRDGFDRETGEIKQDTWDASAEIGKIRRALSMKQCFISRMPEEQTAAFWKETVYSPRDEKHKPQSLMPLKGFGTEGELSTEKYGGYDKTQFAYFFAFSAKDKKGRAKYFFQGVPMHLLPKIASSSQALSDYAEKLANEKNCSDAKILRSKVPLRQKFEMDGTKFYLYGRTGDSNGVRPAVELAFGNGDYELIARIADESEASSATGSSEFLKAYDSIAGGMEKTCPKLSGMLDLKSRRGSFEKLDAGDKRNVIQNLLRVSKGDSQGCDIRKIGGKGKAGYMKVGIGSKIPNIVWIDQSVTGMFEKRMNFEDLTDGI